MRKTLGTLLMVVGYGVGGYVLALGIGFGGILLIPVIATHGEEMGRELFYLVLAVMIIVPPFWYLARWGQRLRYGEKVPSKPQ